MSKDIAPFGRPISRRQFDAYCYCRMPMVRFLVEEIEWYQLFDGRLLALLFRDVTDDDYGFVILGRDERRLFRGIDLGIGLPTAVQARKALALRLSDYRGQVQDIYPQEDVSTRAINLFDHPIPVGEQHRYYRVLREEPRYEGARNLITEIANSFIDSDGHYEQEFQSRNFHARLWELYLHVYLHNAGVLIERNHASPDFEAHWFGERTYIEAVTVNPSEDPARPDAAPPTTPQEIEERLDGFMPIKFGSALYSKQQKAYWDLQHVQGNPLVFAVHDFHNPQAMTWSRTALSEYLYGVRARIVDGKAAVTKIDSHHYNGKTLASGFFMSPGTENVSAVLFSNQATIPKFNRMGKLGGLGSQNVKMIRSGFMYNPDPAAMQPIWFSKDLDDPDYEESWSDGLIMFHNPRAAHPVNPEMFGDISHIWFSDKDGFYGNHQPYDVLGSITTVIATDHERDSLDPPHEQRE